MTVSPSLLSLPLTLSTMYPSMGNKLIKEARHSKIANFRLMVPLSSAGVVLSAYGRILSEQLNTHIISYLEIKGTDEYLFYVILSMKIIHLET